MRMNQFYIGDDRIIAIRLLKGARERIELGFDTSVCPAISSSVQNPHDYEIAARLRNIIKIRLGHLTYVDSWLIQKAGIPTFMLSQRNMRIYRMRWIDSMIAELENVNV